MWSQLLLCALVGFAAASDYGWKSNSEYVYRVQGRTLTGLHDVADQYSGIIMRAKLIVRPESDGKLMAKIADAKYAQIHANLPEGWRSQIHESKLNFQQLPLTEQPFEIKMKNGVVSDLIVSRDVHNWEANFIKSIVSQMQLDTQGENVIKSHVNQLPEEGSNNAVFKTMEDTVTGEYETLYDIAPLPEYVLQAQPWLVPMPQMKGDGEFIEIVKTKNFSRSEQRLGFHFGLGDNEDWEPSTNQMGDFFLRSSISRAVISGDLKQWTLQSSVTTNKIILSPTLNSEQKGMVVSHLNISLSEVNSASGKFEQVQQPQHLGSLVYSYNTPYSNSHEAREGHQRHSSEDNEYSSEEQQQKHQRQGRVQRRNRRSAMSDEHEDESPEFQDSWTQEKPKLTLAPETPLLPSNIGYKGKSSKTSDKIDITQAAQKIAQQIGQDLQRVEKIPEEQTLAKFTILTNLCRIMNEKEMQQVAQQLYTKEQQGPKADAWIAFRDAVAECGTGPALLTIKQLIEDKKIRHEEAAEVLSTMAQSARQPTEEYMRTFFKLATKEEVRSQSVLNDTAILSCATLVRKVYVDKFYSHNQYPVQSFGSFRTNAGKQFVVKEFIPYLKQQLNRAVEKADSHKIQVYIRALGNTAHPTILAAFEPYLEGEKQVSQFQRLQMIVALDKFTQVHPKLARSVLYKTYQNAGEQQEIRCAAVYQLMRTSPPASMLQRMAQYTNIDTDEQVNAAVQSAIQSAAQVETDDELAENARSAEPLLTKNTYGIDSSSNYLRDYVVREMNMAYQQNAQSYGSQDSLLPKGLKYRLTSVLGGVRHEIINAQYMISSIDGLTNVIAEQTELHHQQQKQQRQQHPKALENQWSSESIARLLNIQTEEREQLEGNLLLQLGGGAARYFTFDNHTVELLPTVIREIEESLRQGQEFHYSKFINRNDMVISFPTEMSLPFFYTLNAPTLLHFKGQVRASAEPKISTGERLQKPHTIKAQSEIRAVVSTKVQAILGFVTPFDHQKYISGFDKNVQVYVPMKSEIEIDLKTKEVRAQFQPLESDKDAQVFHYSTWPYTTRQDVLTYKPLALEEESKIVYANQEPQTQWEQTVGKQSGFAFHVEYLSEQQFSDAAWVYEQLSRHDGVSALMAPFNDETIHHAKINVKYDAKKSSASKVELYMGFEKRYESDESNQSDAPNADIKQLSQLPRENKERQQQFAKMAAAGINNAEVRVVDLSIELDGEHKVQYSAIAGFASSSVDQKARAILYAERDSKNHQQCKPYIFALTAKARVPNTNALDFVYALKFDPTSTAQIEIAAGENMESASKIKMNAKLHKSEERKRYLQTHPRAQECREEMKHGNQQLPACANLTAEANLMDRVSFQIQYENVGPKVRNMTQKLYSGLRYLGHYHLDENMVDPKYTAKQNTIECEARFNPDFEAVNVTIRTEKMESHFDEVRVNNWAKQVLAVHPVFPVHTRVMSEALEYDTYRPSCVVDQSAANTFDNTTYGIKLGYSWHVMFQYVPTFARHQQQHQKYQEQQEQQQTEQYAILVRDTKSKDSNKEIKMTIRTPQTQGKLIEIDLKPTEQQQESSGRRPCAKVFVNNKEYQITDQMSTDIEDGFIQMYALPNGEVKVEVRNQFYIIYDGERVKQVVYHDKFQGAVRGLCGTYTGEESDDFRTPKNCILRNPLEFAATWAVEQGGQVQEYQTRAQKSHCAYDETVYANVISDTDAGRRQHKFSRKNQENKFNKASDTCTKVQTQYVTDEAENQICFTIRPVHVCKSSCNASGFIKKSVPVHCVQTTKVAHIWKQQIKNGASPDFSNKEATKNMHMELPESCLRY